MSRTANINDAIVIESTKRTFTVLIYKSKTKTEKLKLSAPITFGKREVGDEVINILPTVFDDSKIFTALFRQSKQVARDKARGTKKATDSSSVDTTITAESASVTSEPPAPKPKRTKPKVAPVKVE